jgi:hypothetical protein
MVDSINRLWSTALIGYGQQQWECPQSASGPGGCAPDSVGRAKRRGLTRRGQHGRRKRSAGKPANIRLDTSGRTLGKLLRNLPWEFCAAKLHKQDPKGLATAWTRRQLR